MGIGFYHLAAYALTMALCYIKSLNGESSLLWTLPLGWAMYCVFMIGHESYHHTMAPRDCKRLNNLIGYFTMDCFFVGKQTWIIKHHMIHHPHPWKMDPPPIDRQRLFGPNVFVETVQSIYTFLGYWALDFEDSFKKKVDLWKLFALTVRLFFWFSLPLNALVTTLIWMVIFANYNSLLAHAVPCDVPTKDELVRQCRTSIDMFPTSKLCVFLTGAMNCHLVHHVIPNLPRSLHPQAAQLLSELYPTEYRRVDSRNELAAVWILRHQHFPGSVLKISDLPTLAKQSGRINQQLFMDLLSFGFFATVCWYLPAAKLI